MSNLDDVARRFREKQLSQAGTSEMSTTIDDQDLDSLIGDRLEASLDAAVASGTDAVVDAAVVSGTDAVVDAASAIVDMAQERWVIPQPVGRALGERSRVAIEVPAVLEPLRLEAKRLGMSSGHLLLAALAEHGDQVLADATAGTFYEVPPRGFTKQWQLGWHESELDRFDDFVSRISPFLPRRSRALVASLLLAVCR